MDRDAGAVLGQGGGQQKSKGNHIINEAKDSR